MAKRSNSVDESILGGLKMPFGEFTGQPITDVPPSHLEALLAEKGVGMSDLSGSELGKIRRCKILVPAEAIVRHWRQSSKRRKVRKPVEVVDEPPATETD